ncbi:fimbrial protein [Enterobacter roggenkampii]|uniref:fimbrial protein n=1 Tax=Enterobacter roggenkampii TaxID=1812935 RepID=UPI001237F32F|nr:fimbrial protein [Enterobacter roggenkampii]
MKIVLPLMLAVMFSISFCEAHDGSVTITGTIQDNTCEVAPDSQNKKVEMGDYAREQFRQKGDSSAMKPFTINLDNCGPAASGAKVTFSGTPDTTDNTLFALETGVEEETASGLALGIYENNGQKISPNSSSSSVPLKPKQASVALDFTARYVAVNDSVTVGSAQTTVTFSVLYD